MSYALVMLDDPNDVHLLAFGDPQIRGANQYNSLRTRLDILGNDYYLGHIYSVLTRILGPSHVAVLGDLLSSQWIDNDEFEIRTLRYKTRIFPKNSGTDSSLVFINVTGNHDIGYSGEMSLNRVSRYKAHYGAVNYVIEVNPSLRMVILNDLALDGPFFDTQFHEETMAFLNDIAQSKFDGTTILLTHVPLEKPKGVCEDGAFFSFWNSELGGGLKSQNFLTYDSSQKVLNTLFKGGKGGIILNGHDHEGCYSTHIFNEELGKWVPGMQDLNEKDQIKEFTVRSMMGEFGGNAGLLSAHWNKLTESYDFDFRLCRFALQHFWWIAYILLIVSGGLLALAAARVPIGKKNI
ncbi:hypothetical protein NADFUDRAFT_71882 [Nadsonia fulvescens var. elongata DSM 6958]|uniref:Calcineurin-like phosphoesterase domain-containing protein n=1 Tax=Nadsonia fulvescens var. elongata DSM 6958 TaxID=857566 RepID=A0A1E3PFE7_9ASCO|nr:hypothetical protein NADFUDRAFT_71882 [Nadsonia fulvescens var. elongata DSM 6958]